MAACSSHNGFRGSSALRAVGALGMLIALALSGCGGGGKGNESGQDVGTDGEALTKVDVGIIPIVAVAPLALGIEQGFFEEEGLDVEMHVAQGGAALVPAVVSGQYDFAFSNNLSLIVARSAGLPLKIVSAANSAGTDPDPIEEALAVPAGSPVQSVEDLAGKTIAVNTLNNIVEVANRATLEAAGVDPTTVEFVEVGFPDMPLALEQGRVDAADIAEPFLTQATEAGATVIARPFRVLQPDLYISSWFTTEETLQAQGDMAGRFMRALEQSKAYAAENPGQIRALLPDLLGIDADLAQNIALAYWPEGQPGDESLTILGDAAVKYGLVKEATLPDVDELVHSQ